ncbi:MAG: cytochrome c oxidase accessory protein CcoG [Gammaproteobacteria bacterium]
MTADPGKPALAGVDDDRVIQSLYAKAEKIYPREVHGLYARLRTLGVLGLLGIYYGLPWLQWDGHQALLLDLPARKFHIFSITLWPQDFIYLASLLIIAGLTLFFVTAIAGRVWCGYACPQTVWTEAFLWIERKVEGDRLKQQKLDAQPLSARKLRIKATKHFLWIAFAGWMREQVCKYMCPYARFQSAMFDKDTLIISYIEERGEPRGSRKRSADPQALGLGACIDCTLCVQVCPTGIDIRNGLQYECIACSACIDACDDVMDKMGYERGLIKYTTENEMEGKPRQLIRPRIVVYALILVAIMGMLAYSFALRVPLGLDVIRDRNQLYRETSEGLIENVYILKILNMDDARHNFELEASGIDGLEIHMDLQEISVPGGAVLELPVRLRVDEAALGARSSEVRFQLVASDKPELVAEEEARFLGPR